MPDDDFTLTAHYLRHIAEQVGRRGVDVDAWLTECGLSSAKLAAPGFQIDFPRFERLVRTSLTVTGEPALGLFVGQRLVANSHGMLGYAAMSSATVRQAVELLARYTRVRTSMLTVSHDVVGERARVRFHEARPLGDIRRPVLDAVVLSIKNVLDAISLGACKVLEASFPFAAPSYSTLARDLFGCDVKYGRSWAGFAVPAASLDAPLKLADPDAFREAALICQRELDKLTADESSSAKVRRLLLENQSGFPSLQVAARTLHTTPRTLHRRLIDEGTSYRALVDEIRHGLALEHLKAGGRLEELAYRLGYSDLANFRRAFKRWEGVAPSLARAR